MFFLKLLVVRGGLAGTKVPSPECTPDVTSLLWQFRVLPVQRALLKRVRNWGCGATVGALMEPYTLAPALLPLWLLLRSRSVSFFLVAWLLLPARAHLARCPLLLPSGFGISLSVLLHHLNFCPKCWNILRTRFRRHKQTF